MTSPKTLARVEQTCAELIRGGHPITFTDVAAQSGISRTSLYRDPTLRAVIEEHRTRSNDPRTLSGLSAEISHLRTALEALAERVKHHDEQLRRLERDRRTRQAN
jgi:hypothetical protein